MSERAGDPAQEKVFPSPKPQEVIQAQAGLFATEHVEDQGDKERVFRAIQETQADPQRSYDLPEQPTQEETRMAGLKEAYVNFLRAVGGQNHESIQARASLLAAYDQFRPMVEDIQSRFASDEEKRLNRSAGGSQSHIFFTESSDGTQFVVRLSRPKRGASDIDSYLAGAILARGLPHFEQIVAAS